MASGAGGIYPNALCGLNVLYSNRHRSMSTFASRSVSKISPSRSSSLSLPLNDSTYPFSQGLPGSIYSGAISRFPSQLLRAFAMNSGPLSDRMYSGRD